MTATKEKEKEDQSYGKPAMTLVRMYVLLDITILTVN
jgi:hypothetical protein